MNNISLSVDAVIFGYASEELFVILIQRKNEPFKGKWALPGGFVEADENLEDAAKRELQEETGIRVNHLEQVYAFGEPHRDPRGRTVSVAYYDLVKKDAYHPIAADDATEAQWFSLMDLPELAFDHPEIVHASIQKLDNKLKNKLASFENHFTISELQEIQKILADKNN